MLLLYHCLEIQAPFDLTVSVKTFIILWDIGVPVSRVENVPELLIVGKGRCPKCDEHMELRNACAESMVMLQQWWSLCNAGCPLQVVPVKSLGIDGINRCVRVRSNSADCR